LCLESTTTTIPQKGRTAQASLEQKRFSFESSPEFHSSQHLLVVQQARHFRIPREARAAALSLHTISGEVQAEAAVYVLSPIPMVTLALLLLSINTTSQRSKPWKSSNLDMHMFVLGISISVRQSGMIIVAAGSPTTG
jgi:hypothetical protein